MTTDDMIKKYGTSWFKRKFGFLPILYKGKYMTEQEIKAYKKNFTAVAPSTYVVNLTTVYALIDKHKQLGNFDFVSDLESIIQEIKIPE